MHSSHTASDRNLDAATRALRDVKEPASQSEKSSEGAVFHVPPGASWARQTVEISSDCSGGALVQGGCCTSVGTKAQTAAWPGASFTLQTRSW